MRLFIMAIACLFLAASCGTKKVAKLEEANGKTLILSHGGGFTGEYVTYYLLENGQLFQGGEIGGPYNEVKRMKKTVTEQIFANYNTLGLEDLGVESYGNLNYTIAMQEGNDEHKLIWNDGQKGSEKLQLFYRNVMNMIAINNGQTPAQPNSKIKLKF